MGTSPNYTNLCFSLFIFSLVSFAHSTDLNCDDGDKAVLLQIKSHFGGDSGPLSSWDPDITCCEWNYVGCTVDGDEHPGRVNAITVSRGSGLSGEIPAVIGNIPYLQEIMFTGERNLTGPIPQALNKLKYLQILYLNLNGLTGQIPQFLGGLKKLQQIDISYNRLTGSIPRSLATLPALTNLTVAGNQLCGPIPKGLKKFGATSFQQNKCLCGAPLSAC